MDSKPSVYLETTIVSYLTARPSRDLIYAAHQRLTKAWWDNRRDRFETRISQLVLDEAALGDPDAAGRRMAVLHRIQTLAPLPQAEALTNRLLRDRAFPAVAGTDAAHVALAAVHAMEYLLTWNCAHINNAQVKHVIESVCGAEGYRCPVICTPEELMGDVP